MSATSEILAAIEWNVSGDVLRQDARREGESPKVFARQVSKAIRESFVERGMRPPFSMGAIRRAIQARMGEL